ncbi:podoplanin isoform X2 [Oryzias latipes]|uniref:podoplanin isoform X2 n=1 Tax=Oryzias latipes TaxID=8090 RepID=UPI0002A4AE1D|nr:podoplanin isoform X2 [Oryzias latipes]
MKVQLLLLVALAGPFCAFTSASPTFPTELLSASPEKNEETSNVDSSVLAETSVVVITGPPPTQPEALPGIVSDTESTPGAAPTTEYDSTAFVFTERQDVFTKPMTETATDAAQTEAPAVETLAPETSAPDAVTDPQDPGHENPVTQQEDYTEGPKMEEELGDEVTVEEESLSSGQIIGIVIGALLAVVIFIAVVIAVVRRMGKYSP